METVTASNTIQEIDQTAPGRIRVHSLDIIRGIIMILMAIDHVRVYSGIPAGGPDAGVFFTRWITHFCAPGFAFFAGTSAFLYGIKINDKAKLARYLVTRGLLLVFLELTVIRFFWAFNVSTDFILAGVIWMLGWCMVMLGGLIYLKPRVVGILGLAVILLQQLFAFPPQMFSGQPSAFTQIWEFIYPSGFESFNGVSVLYSIVPWIGVMAAGYGFGLIVTMENERRKKICMAIGSAGIAIYLIAGSAIILQQPADGTPFIFKLLNQSKYPASQLFLMMTLGPMIMLMPYAEKMKGTLSNAIAVIGRVPFFYYLCHILLIHFSALIVQMVTLGATHGEWYDYAPYASVPEEHRWSLGLLYLVFLIDLIPLYILCKWYARVKLQKAGSISWLSYL